MRGLEWRDFYELAQVSICRECKVGGKAPWRGNTSCLQAWLRFHSSRGIILSCQSSRHRTTGPRIEDSLMLDHTPADLVAPEKH